MVMGIEGAARGFPAQTGTGSLLIGLTRSSAVPPACPGMGMSTAGHIIRDHLIPVEIPGQVGQFH